MKNSLIEIALLNQQEIHLQKGSMFSIAIPSRELTQLKIQIRQNWGSFLQNGG